MMYRKSLVHTSVVRSYFQFYYRTAKLSNSVYKKVFLRDRWKNTWRHVPPSEVFVRKRVDEFSFLFYGMTSRAIYQFMNYNFPTIRAVVTQNYYSKGDFLIVDCQFYVSKLDLHRNNSKGFRLSKFSAWYRGLIPGAVKCYLLELSVAKQRNENKGERGYK